MQINANKIRIDWIILTTNYITPLLRCVFYDFLIATYLLTISEMPTNYGNWITY